MFDSTNCRQGGTAGTRDCHKRLALDILIRSNKYQNIIASNDAWRISLLPPRS